MLTTVFNTSSFVKLQPISLYFELEHCRTVVISNIEYKTSSWEYRNNYNELQLQPINFQYKTPKTAVEWGTYLAGHADINNGLQIKNVSQKDNVYDFGFFFWTHSWIIQFILKEFFLVRLEDLGVASLKIQEREKMFFPIFTVFERFLLDSHVANSRILDLDFFEHINENDFPLFVFCECIRSIEAFDSISRFWDELVSFNPELEAKVNQFYFSLLKNACQVDNELGALTDIQLREWFKKATKSVSEKEWVFSCFEYCTYKNPNINTPWYFTGLLEGIYCNFYFSLPDEDVNEHYRAKIYDQRTSIESSPTPWSDYDFKVLLYPGRPCCYDKVGDIYPVPDKSLGVSVLCMLMFELKFGAEPIPMRTLTEAPKVETTVGKYPLNDPTTSYVIYSNLGIASFLDYLDKYPPLSEHLYYSYYYFRSAFMLVQNIRLRENYNEFKPTSEELKLLKSYEINLQHVRAHYLKPIWVNDVEERLALLGPEWKTFWPKISPKSK